MKRLLTVVGISLSIFSFPLPAHAQATRSIPLSQARGDGAIVTIDLYRGHGTTLNFRPTGETIRRAWLDDLSNVTLSFDDTDCSLGGEGDCAASVIHLRRINPLEFPHLPATDTTLLTVLTDAGLYLFRLSLPDSGNPNYYSVEIEPDSIQAEQPQQTVTKLGSEAGAQLIEQGMVVAKSRNLIAESDPLWERLQQVVIAVRQGVEVAIAAEQVGVSQALITRLVELGRTVSPAMTL